MRIAGTRIPEEKRLVISLTYILGVGPARAKKICEAVKIDESVRVKDLSSDDQQKIRDILVKLGYELDADLRRELSQNVKRLQDIGSYRGYRHRRRLPCRGQRTKTNAKTRKKLKKK